MNQPLLAMLFRELHGMVYLCRVDEFWTMEMVSPGCERVTGYRPDDILHNRRLSYEEITHPDDRKKVRDQIDWAIENGQSFSVEYRIIDAQGKLRWVWEKGHEIQDAESSVRLIHGYLEDITERRLREQALEIAEKRYRGIFENATEGIFQCSSRGDYLAANPSMASLLGYDSPAAFLATSKNIRDIIVAPQAHETFFNRLAVQGRVHNFETQLGHRDGTQIWVSINAHTIKDTQGEPLYIEGTVQDISSKKAYQALLLYQANHDPLTELPNRALLETTFDKELAKAGMLGTQVAAVYLDLDHFKNVNDSLGHETGDQLLQTIAKRLKENIRPGDMIARMGGDEFVILLAGINGGISQVLDIVQKLQAALAIPFILPGREYLITSSIGVSLYPQHGEDTGTLLRNADIAMYKAKHKGRNIFALFNPELKNKLRHKLLLEQRLRLAEKRNELELVYQPKYDLASGELSGAEALLRWNRNGPGCSPIMPSEFIPIAEETGLINAIGLWVVTQACQTIAQWRQQGHTVVPIAVNLSVHQFHDRFLTRKIGKILERFDVPGQLLAIEVTESWEPDEEPAFIEALKDLKAMGLTVAIDDFGTGYSNMHSLKTLPCDYLKIDRSFIRDVESSEQPRAIYRAILAMASHLGYKVIAEGVESAAQLDFLRSARCDEAQGYHLAHPMNVDAFTRLLDYSDGISPQPGDAGPGKLKA